jgi:hypothetical protein
MFHASLCSRRAYHQAPLSRDDNVSFFATQLFRKSIAHDGTRSEKRTPSPRAKNDLFHLETRAFRTVTAYPGSRLYAPSDIPYGLSIDSQYKVALQVKRFTRGRVECRMRRVGIDAGGTLTDVVLLDSQTGEVWSAKVPTTPKDPTQGAVNGLCAILKRSKSQPVSINFIGHRTTIATNMGKGAFLARVVRTGPSRKDIPSKREFEVVRRGDRVHDQREPERVLDATTQRRKETARIAST